MKRAIRFRVEPADDGLYWRVHVYPTRDKMLRGFRVINVSKDHREDFSAIVMPMTEWQRAGREWKKTKLLGHVLFYARGLCGEVVSHEAVHMATSYLRRKRCSLHLNSQINDREERLAYCVGYCVGKITNVLHKARIWK